MAVSSATASDAASLASLASPAGSKTGDAGSADRFLKLLVAQMQNQDPLNPMDNAQVTSQMAQINTVSGIEKLNSSVQTLQTQFVQMQALQGAGLVGRDVIVPGNVLDITEGKVGQGGFELQSAADSVKVEILNGAKQVVGTLDLGAQTAGMHGFDWDASKASDASYTFRVTAKSGATTLSSTALMRDRVDAVSVSGRELELQLARSGGVSYDTIKSFN